MKKYELKDFEKAYEKLADQIRTEFQWALDDKESTKDFKRGMVFAYGSIMSTIEAIENGSLIIDEDRDEEEDYEDEDL